MLYTAYCILYAVYLYSEQSLDQIHGVRADFAPRRGRKHKLRVLDLLSDLLVLVEWKCAGQRYVNDHADGPHVQRLVVPWDKLKFPQISTNSKSKKFIEKFAHLLPLCK